MQKGGKQVTYRLARRRKLELCEGKTGYYAANQWIQDTDGKWYYFDMAAVMLADTTTLTAINSGCQRVYGMASRLCCHKR